MSSKDKRKLAAIMFADVVGYSRMMASNEERTLELLKDFENICSPIISKNTGKIIKKVGDELFCEFSSAKEAVDCAIEIQEAIQPYNDSRPKDYKLQVRIGIHVGDIVLRDGDVFGDGVNIASRIQPFASPGGICVSNAVRDALSSHPNYDIQSEGKQELKNIIEKHTLYSIKTGYEDITKTKKYKKSKFSITIGILVVLIVGVLFFRDSLNFWEMGTSELSSKPEKVLIHITSLPEYIDEYITDKQYYNTIKGRKLVPLSYEQLDSVRKNINSLLLGEFIGTPFEMIIKYYPEDVKFLNKYSLLEFDDVSFSNVLINYKRFKPDKMHYINIYQYEKETENSNPIYFFREMRWLELPDQGFNGSLLESDFTNIEDRVLDVFRNHYSGVGKVGKVSSIKDDIVYLKLTNLKVRKGMILTGASLYNYAKDGRKRRVDDLTNGITYLSSFSDSASKIQIKLYNDEIISIQNGTGFNWFSDSLEINDRLFTKGFMFKLKIIDLQADSIAIAEVMKLDPPYVTIREGDEVWINKLRK